MLLPREKLPGALVVPWRVEQDLVGTGDRIRRELDYEPLIDLEEGIRRAVAWEKENPPDPIPEEQLAYEAQDQVLAGL